MLDAVPLLKTKSADRISDIVTRGMLENAPINILYADREYNITYVNPKSLETLKTLEEHLPIPSDEILGSSIDVFHKMPAHQRKMLSNDKNLPHRTIITLGPEKLDLFVSAIYDEQKQYIGAMVTWEVVTEKLASQEALSRTQSMMENAPVNIMYADRDFKITYINPKSKETLRTIEKHLPISVDKMLGSSIDVFHKNPEHQRRILSSDKNLPTKAIISVGPEKLDLLVSPIYDDKKHFIGSMVTWDVVTKKLEMEEGLARTQAMVENAPINVMMCDLNFKLIYMNPASKNTLKTLEKHLPKPVDQLVGESVDIFHKSPEHQRRIIADDRKLPHRAKIKVGPETLDLLVSPTYDANKKYLGAMVTWERITEKLELVNSIGEASRHLSAAAAELNATATQMASNASRTSNEANSVATASEEVSRGVRTVATNTEEMTAAIKEIARNANDASGASTATMKEAEATNVTVAKLGESSLEIGNVVKVISSIAQQTNLLALNATIEAARAGDAGRGFAVVANEVKELAKQTGKATEDITAKIGAIQKDTTSAVGAIGGITHSIKKLNGIASSIAAAVEEQQATTNEVARVVQESSKGVQNIAESIKTVSTASTETQAGAAQLLDAAKSLAQLADKLEQLVKKIQV